MGRTGSNHELNRVESWVERGRIMGRTGSNHGSNRVESLVEQGQSLIALGRMRSRFRGDF